MSRTYTEQMIEFVESCRPEDIPQDVKEQCELLLLDALGVALYNSEKPFVRKMNDVVGRSIKQGPCTVVGHRASYVAEGAALLNSSAIHGNDFDATHVPAIMHTSTVVIPTAFAVAEEVGCSGSELIASTIAGFELLIRMGLATQGAMHRVGFQSTALCAPMVLAMVAGRLYRMPQEQIVSAAGLSASIAAGLRAFSDDGTWGKRLITGWACRAALMAVELAKEGFPGTRDVLEKKPFGFYNAFLQKGGYDLQELTRSLGQDWTTLSIDIKRYPCSHGHHAFIDTARRARSELSLQPEQIEVVHLHVSNEARKWWFEPRDRKYELTDVYGSRFSMPYTIALTLIFGNLRDEYLDSREFLDDRRVRTVVNRVHPKLDESLSNSNPNRLPGTIEIVTKDGKSSVFAGTGHAGNKDELRSAVIEKFVLNTSGIGRNRADRIIDLATSMEKQASVSELASLLKN